MEKKTKKKGISLKWARALTICYFVVIVVLFLVNTDATIDLFGLLVPGWLVFGAALAVGVAAAIAESALLKCGRCGHSMQAFNIAFEGQRYKFCPYCGGEIEIE